MKCKAHKLQLTASAATMRGVRIQQRQGAAATPAADKQCDRIFNDQCQMKSEKRWNGNKLKR